MATPTFTYSTTDTGGRTDLSPATYTLPVGTTVSGTVFEDVNYGGGTGRPAGTAGTSARPGATVELYDASGNYLTSTTTNASGPVHLRRRCGRYLFGARGGCHGKLLA